MSHISQKNQSILNTLNERNNFKNVTIGAICHSETPKLNFHILNIDKDELIKLQKADKKTYSLGLADKKGFTIHEEVLYSVSQTGNLKHHPRIYVPRKMRMEIAQLSHLKTAHQGISKSLELMYESFYWPNAQKEMTKVLSTCGACQLSLRKRGNVPPLTPNPSSEIAFPNDTIGIDYCGPMPPSSRGSRYLLMIIDWFSRNLELYAYPTK